MFYNDYNLRVGKENPNLSIIISLIKNIKAGASTALAFIFIYKPQAIRPDFIKQASQRRTK